MSAQVGPVPQKIVLKSTTKMSLNERFSNIEPPRVTPQTIRVTMAAQSLGNSKNKRFAQQMANRPAAAQNVTYIKKRNIQQRLGSNVKTRLGGVQQRGRGFRGGRGGFIQRGGFVQRGGSQQRGRGRGVLVYSRGGRGALRTPRANNTRGRGGYRGGRGANRGTSGYNSYRGNVGNRGAARGTRGRGRGRGAQRPQASREDLDTQLDAYMSGSNKTFIDADLGDL